jgi:ABC-type glycerol-3-phosphate transport system substrate-binding protein
MNGRLLNRRTLLAILGSGLAASSIASCGSAPPPAPTAVPTQVPQPTVAPSPTLQPTIVPSVTPPQATATPKSPTVRIAAPDLDHYNEFLGLRLQNAAQKLPPGQRFAVQNVRVPVNKAGVAVQTAAELGSHFAEQIAAGVFAADLLLCDNATLGALATKDLLRDLGPLLGKESWYKPEDFWGNILQTGQIFGKQLGLPLDASVELVVYNRKQLQQKNVSEPPTAWTWDQLIATATALAEKDKTAFRVSNWSPSIFSLAWQNGAQLVDTKGKLRVTEPGTIRALEFLDNLVHTRHVSAPLDAVDLAWGSDNPFTFRGNSEGDPFPYQLSLRKEETAMLAGQSAMKFYGVWWEDWKDHFYTDLGVSALPRGEHPTVLGATWTILGIPANAANPDQSFAALGLLLDAFEPGAFLPARRSVADLRAIDPLITARDAEVLSASLPIARFLPGDVGLPILDLVAKELVLPVIMGKKKPQDAANDAQKAIDALLAP